MDKDDPIMERLENQIEWYDKKSQDNQKWFKQLKVFEIFLAAMIPFSAGFHWPAWLTGGFGVLIVIIEGIQSLYQHHHNWITYRSTCEYLKHEKYLFLGSAGPYVDLDNPKALLTERIETLVSQEHAKWISACEKVAERKK